jgi:hypothetical protein
MAINVFDRADENLKTGHIRTSLKQTGEPVAVLSKPHPTTPTSLQGMKL